MASRLAEVTGIFMTGGNRLKLSGIINGTRRRRPLKLRIDA